MEKTGKKILVIDDDRKHLITVKEILETEGHDVYMNAQPFGSTSLARLLKPDLILLDVNMPGLSGESLARIILLHSGGSAPVVFYSSNDEDSLRKLVALHGARGYICKGDLYALRERVARYLAEAERYGGRVEAGR